MAVKNPSAEARTDQQDRRTEFHAPGDGWHRSGGTGEGFSGSGSRGKCWHRRIWIGNAFGLVGVAWRNVVTDGSSAVALAAIGEIVQEAGSVVTLGVVGMDVVWHIAGCSIGGGSAWAGIGRGDGGGPNSGLLEIRENLLGLKLTFAQGGEIVGYGFFLVEADLAGVGADEPLIENTAGKLVEVFFLEGAQHARTNFGGVGNGLERKAALLTLLAKFFSEGSHSGSGGRGWVAARLQDILMIGEGASARQKSRGRGTDERAVSGGRVAS